MRYLDWDVLLFPSGEGAEGAHTPLKEFKTQAQVEFRERGVEPTPILTTFAPSLPAGKTFQVSVHSWSRTEPVLLPAPDGTRPRELWEARVVVDGQVATVAHLPIDAQWPQIITTATHEDGQELSEQQPLLFPPFNAQIRNERGWLASDVRGRIRIELSTGVWEENHGGYVKLANVVTFSFQHAPLNILEHAGIAWPSQKMLSGAVPVTSPMQKVYHIPATQHTPHLAHRKMPSVSSLQLPGMSSFGQPFAGPGNPYQNYGNDIDASSRSTSAYSTLSNSAGPVLVPGTLNGQGHQQQPSIQPTAATDGQVQQFRIPSDQLNQLINALSARSQETQPQQPAESMPPPPLPAHTVHLKTGVDSTPQGHFVPQQSSMQRSEIDQHAISAFDRRAASNSGYSDVSMHAGCNRFPHCISEDPSGCIVHDGAPAPAAAVKGRKEGSSPTKPRDFFSVTLDAAATSAGQSQPPPPMTIAPKDMMTNRSPSKEASVALSSLVSSSPADANGKKRTRSAMKDLNINDGGSPQKADAANKPVRKASRASVSSVKSHGNDKENVAEFLVDYPEALENQESMMLDA